MTVLNVRFVVLMESNLLYKKVGVKGVLPPGLPDATIGVFFTISAEGGHGPIPSRHQ